MIVVVIYVVGIILYGIFKKVNTFDSFSRGVSSNFKVLLTIFPNILVIILAINIFTKSGIIEILNDLISDSPIAIELFIQCLLKPISSSSSMIMMVRIFETYGVNSANGLISSIIQGCSDTTIYIVVIYFSSIKMKKTKYALTAGLLTDLLTFIIIFIVGLLFIF